MRKSRFNDEFKAEAIKQITERGHKVIDVAQRLGISHLKQKNIKKIIRSYYAIHKFYCIEITLA